MSLAHITFILFISAVFVQQLFLSYYQYSFARHKSKRIDPQNQPFGSLTVLIVARNEKPNLSELLPLIFSQDYPEFKILVVDDHSTDGTGDWIAPFCKDFPSLKYHPVTHGQQGKKAALLEAIPHLKSDLILFTDADCRPSSNQWLRLMAESMTPDKSVVLGYSPYIEKKGVLNELIRLETAYTASLYFAFAIKGNPYMGVGRNLLFRTPVWIEHFQPDQYVGLLSGDDDLTINKLKNIHHVEIQYEPSSWVFSIPKESWKAWLTQKKRHVTTAQFYQTQHAILLFSYYSTFVVSWALAILLGLFNYWIWIFWIIYKLVQFTWLVKPCLNKLGLVLYFWHWLSAECIYSLSLIYLLPYGFSKKNVQW